MLPRDFVLAAIALTVSGCIGNVDYKGKESVLELSNTGEQVVTVQVYASGTAGRSTLAEVGPGLTFKQWVGVAHDEAWPDIQIRLRLQREPKVAGDNLDLTGVTVLHVTEGEHYRCNIFAKDGKAIAVRMNDQ